MAHTPRRSRQLLIKARAIGWQKSKARGRSQPAIPHKSLGGAGRRGRKR